MMMHIIQALTNVIRYECGLVKAELEPDSEGVLKIKKM